ncbi:unnamed protein product, partial [Polarella glacialis]
WLPLVLTFSAASGSTEAGLRRLPLQRHVVLRSRPASELEADEEVLKSRRWLAEEAVSVLPSVGCWGQQGCWKHRPWASGADLLLGSGELHREAVDNLNDLQYIADVAIGTPTIRSLKLILDTGSSDLW